MIIRCKKCFKKYDDIESECPRCGKINDRDFNRKDKKYTKRDKINTDVLEKVGKFFIRKFVNTVNCEFCSSEANGSFQPCPVCKNSNLSKMDEDTINSMPKADKLHEITDSIVSKSTKVVDLEAFKKSIEGSGFKIENWKAPYEGDFGTIPKLKLLLAQVSGFILLFIFLFNVTSGFNFFGALLFTIVTLAIVASIIAIFHTRMFTEKIRFQHFSIREKYGISYFKRNGRNGFTTFYEIRSEEIKFIEIDLDIRTHELKSIVITAKEKSEIEQPIFKVNVEQYHKNNNLKLFLLLFCAVSNTNLYILKTKDDVKAESKKEDLLFVRIDTKVEGQVLSEEEYEAHLSYLEKLSSERYFRGGGFKNNGGMIVFSADTFEDAKFIAKNDPLFQNNKYIYQLEQWEVLLKSE